MKYTILSSGNKLCFVVSNAKDDSIDEMSFVVENSGDLNLLQNALKMCQDNLYNISLKDDENAKSKQHRIESKINR